MPSNLKDRLSKTIAPLFLYLAIAVIFPLPAVAFEQARNGPLIAALQDAMNYLPRGARVSVVVQAGDGRALFTQNADQLVAPASTIKLLTAMAAWQMLGPDFRFKTRLLVAADGDAGLIFSGDPLLQRSDIRALLEQARALGVTAIEGDFVLDGTVFSGHDVSSAQSWDDLTICFAAPASAISVNHNCVQGNLQAKRAGQPARIYVSPDEPLRIDNQIEVLEPEPAKAAFCGLELSHLGLNQYRIDGCTAALDAVLPLSIAVNDPHQYAKAIVRAELESAGIALTGKVRIASRPFRGRFVAGHQSAPLAEFVGDMLQKSDNQLADALFRTMGYRWQNAEAEDGHRAATYRAGIAALRATLQALDIDIGNGRIADGSGLSRHNLLSASVLAQVLTRISAMEDRRLQNALPVSGVSGSLKYRRGLLNPPLQGRVAAKTGSLSGVINLAGFLDSKNAGTVRFVLLIDGFHLAPELAESIADTPGNHPLKKFYEAFLSAVYHHAPVQ